MCIRDRYQRRVRGTGASSAMSSLFDLEFSSDDDAGGQVPPEDILNAALLRELQDQERQIVEATLARERAQTELAQARETIRHENLAQSRRAAAERSVEKRRLVVRVSKVLAEQAALLLTQMAWCDGEAHPPGVDEVMRVHAEVERLLASARHQAGALQEEEELDQLVVSAEADDQLCRSLLRRTQMRASDAEREVVVLQQALRRKELEVEACETKVAGFEREMMAKEEAAERAQNELAEFRLLARESAAELEAANQKLMELEQGRFRTGFADEVSAVQEGCPEEVPTAHDPATTDPSNQDDETTIGGLEETIESDTVVQPRRRDENSVGPPDSEANLEPVVSAAAES
eukprot:TRINITY_DN27716_c0_g1_i3.p1 TRINITY_DN27716_c0_g1~~TRINITY_DN27716_c0_g1_i3.p1  ORF type:complete len:348 (-),score=119.12 TRINITY_DN27716_c0_g1_i3:391-1434(-)